MNDARHENGEVLWIGLCVLLVLLVFGGGAVLWYQRQHAVRAAELAAMSRMQAEQALAAAEAARQEALASQAAPARASAEAGGAPGSSAGDPDSTTGEGGPAPAVPELYLNQDLWRHVESLADAGPEDKVFTLDSRSGEVLFGDGAHGARPPGGTTTVQATYRTGGSGGTITVFLPAADLGRCRLRAVLSTDGMLRLEVFDPMRDDGDATPPAETAPPG
jgi:hypothetical protein